MKKLALSLIAIVAVLVLGTSSASANSITFGGSDVAGVTTLESFSLSGPFTGTGPYVLTGSGTFNLYILGVGTGFYTYTLPTYASLPLGVQTAESSSSNNPQDDTVFTPTQPVDFHGIVLLLSAGGPFGGDYIWLNGNGTVDLQVYNSAGTFQEGLNNPPPFTFYTPEPSSLVLLGTGMLGAAFLLFRRNRTVRSASIA